MRLERYCTPIGMALVLTSALIITLTMRPVQAAPLTLPQLMSALAKATPGAATFTEKKYISILDEPVASSGELLFIPPARLEKRQLKPRTESMVLDGSTITLARGRSKRVLQLQDYPEVAGMIESIRATLAGDRKALERVYHLSLQGERARWILTLVPHDPGVGKVVAQIKITGWEGTVRTVEILQTDGDRSVMQIMKLSAP